jgi:FkbM family methyltransferase
MKNMVKRVLRRFGLELARYRPRETPAGRVAALLRDFDIDLVLDVGANRGQYAAGLRQAGYAGVMVCFEPLSAEHAVLQAASARDPTWHVHPRCAIGEREGTVEINIAGNSESSSLLPMLDSHRAAAPESAYIGSESVPLLRLDTAAAEPAASARNIFIKIDAQGYEWQVLDGAAKLLPKVRGVQIELSLVPLYQGQRLWLELVARLQGERFAAWTFLPGFVDPRLGRTLQVDAIFFRAPSS